VLRKCTGRNLYNDPENTFELSTNTNQSHRKKGSGNGLLLKRLVSKSFKLKSSTTCVHEDDFSQLQCKHIMTEEEEGVWTELQNWRDQVLFWCLLPGMCDTNARQTFCMDFFAIFFHSSIDHSSGTKNIRMIESFWVWQVSRRLHGSSNISNSHSLVLEATRDIDKWNRISLAYSEFIYSWNFLMT